MEFFLIFIFGLFFGSFLLVVATRLPRSESFFTGRSYCEFCKHELNAIDLVPVFSYLSTKGKCRYCHRKLSIEYPLSELGTGILYTATYYLTLLNNSNPVDQVFVVQLVFNLIIVSILITLFFADMKYYVLPFQIMLPAIFFLVVWQWYYTPDIFINYVLSGVGAFLFFFLIFGVTKGRGMGFGDVVLAFFMGLLLGFPNIVVGLYIAFLTGAAISLILIIRGKKKLKGGVIPFGPFLIVGTYISLFCGDSLAKIIFTYLNLWRS